MNIYHAWCDLKQDVSDIAFSEGVAKYLDHLRTQGLIESCIRFYAGQRRAISRSSNRPNLIW